MLTFDNINTHPKSKNIIQQYGAPVTGDVYGKFKIGRVKCISILYMLVAWVSRDKLAPELKIIPHTKKKSVCWLIEPQKITK